MRQRTFYTFVGIIIVTILAIVTDVSGLGPYTLNIGHPITIRQGLDLQGGARFLLKASPAAGQKIDDSTMDATRAIIESRVNGGFGVAEPVIQIVKGNNDQRFVSVELPGLRKNLQDVEKNLQQTGQLTLIKNGSTPLQKGQSTSGFPVLARGTDIIAKTVVVGTDQLGAPAVDFQVRDPAATAIGDYTASHVGGFMAIAIDNKVYDNPSIQQAIPGGQIQITNVGSLANAQSLAVTLKYGALPVPLKIVGVQDVSASLGPSNVRHSILAGLVGLLIVVLFMAIYYRLPGLLADCALVIYALVIFAAFKLIPNFTLTLPGIAGFILSIGMAVDANILIFERTKEELRAGRSVAAAVDAGFTRAWPSIRDSNISTMITCLILWWFGSNFAASIIVGFATTLLIGVIISMITAILVSRTFLRLVLAGNHVASPSLFGADVAPPTPSQTGRAAGRPIGQEV